MVCDAGGVFLFGLGRGSINGLKDVAFRGSELQRGGDGKSMDEGLEVVGWKGSDNLGYVDEWK